MNRISSVFKALILLILVLSFACDHKFRNPFDPDTEIKPDEWAPDSLKVVALDDSHIWLTWTQSEPQIEGYQISRKTGSATGFTLLTKTYTTEYIDSLLKISTNYIYQVCAYAGDNLSNSCTSNTIRTFLNAPTNLDAIAIDDQKIRLTWTDECSIESGFRIERRVGSGSFVQIAEVAADQTTFDNTGLTYGETYTYRVRAYTQINQSGYSNENSAQMIIHAPTIISATAIDDQTIRLNWTDNCLFESGYRIERKTGSGSFAQIIEVNANSTQCEETGLTYGETYTYRVRAYTQINQSDYSNENSVQIMVFAPTNLSVTAIDDQSIRLIWTDNCSFETGYRIERKTGTGSFVQIAEINANSTEYEETGLSYSEIYTYRVRAFTLNNQSNYSNEMVDPRHITDIDGNVYKTVRIGTQVWMAENLKVTHYRNGDAIPNITDGEAWENLSTGAYCNYDNDVNKVATYGRLYNWYVVNDSRNIAPTGWHVPTDAEWQTLVDYLGGSSVAGGKMKEAGTTHWYSPNTGATNESGFSALPGGERGQFGDYNAIVTNGWWWSATADENYSGNAWDRHLGYDSSAVYHESPIKTCGSSVRCVRD